ATLMCNDDVDEELPSRPSFVDDSIRIGIPLPLRAHVQQVLDDQKIRAGGDPERYARLVRDSLEESKMLVEGERKRGVEPEPREVPRIRCRCDKHDIELGQDPYEAHRKWEEEATKSIATIPPKTVITPKPQPGDLVLPEIQHADEVGRDVGAMDWLRNQ